MSGLSTNQRGMRKRMLERLGLKAGRPISPSTGRMRLRSLRAGETPRPWFGSRIAVGDLKNEVAAAAVAAAVEPASSWLEQARHRPSASRTRVVWLHWLLTQSFSRVIAKTNKSDTCHASPAAASLPPRPANASQASAVHQAGRRRVSSVQCAVCPLVGLRRENVCSSSLRIDRLIAVSARHKRQSTRNHNHLTSRTLLKSNTKRL